MRPTNVVLDGIDFTVDEGSVCALVGKSGGGKSTLVHLLLRFYDPQAGRISLGGVDYRDLNLASLHKQIGVVSQETQLFNATIQENIAYGAPPHTDAELAEATRAACASEFIASFEDGLLTRVGERGQRLSGGQRQRLAIARAILRNPAILILDEATSQIDTDSEAQINAALAKFIQDRTTFVIAHRLSTVVNADQIVVMSDGAIASIGKHQELLENSDVYRVLCRTQLHAATDG